MGEGVGRLGWECIDAQLIRAMRQEETYFISRRHDYDYSMIDESVEHSGKPPTSVRWVEAQKGDSDDPNARSRLVARDFKAGRDRYCFYASKPPLEANDILIAKTAEIDGQWQSKEVAECWKNMSTKVNNALLEVDCDRERTR